ncbi:MAG: transposase [Candidatus Aminicenantes bacterium]|nr:transposase [Candidatus Aminicenantes bacterium]
MARIKRLNITGEDAYYHIVTRTIGQKFLLKKEEKEKLLQIIKEYSALFFVKVTGFVLMSNHMHLIVKMETGENCRDEEIDHRLDIFYEGKTGNKTLKSSGFAAARKKLADISEYVKRIKQSFSFWYNQRHQVRGFFWDDRSKNVLLENGESMLYCLAYIELNPVRAGIMERPEDYSWSSLNYRVRQGNKDRFLSFAGIFSKEEPEVLSRYLDFVHRAGGIETPSGGKVADRIGSGIDGRGYAMPEKAIFCKRMRYFSDGLAIGSKSFIASVYERFAGHAFFKKERKAHAAGFSDNIFSVRHLS